MYRDVLTVPNRGIAEAVYGDFFLNMTYGICHYWIKADPSKKELSLSCYLGPC